MSFLETALLQRAKNKEVAKIPSYQCLLKASNLIIVYSKALHYLN